MVPNQTEAGGHERDRPLEDTLEMLANLIYLARGSQPGSVQQARYLELAAEALANVRRQ